MIIDKIQQIEIDVSTKCNARCPQCVRNYYGSYTWPSLPLIDIDINMLFKGISASTWADLKHLRLCGTYGDPCMHKKLSELVQRVKQVSNTSITINTNGGIRSKRWWSNLAKILDPVKDTVVFGIDGLSDTNHLYRIGVDYHKVIENLTAFNNAGGNSVWQFLVFKHNQHQVDQAKTLARELGCSNFFFKKTDRFVDKAHRITNQTPVLDDNGNIKYYLEPPTESKYINQGYDNINNIITFHGNYKQYLAKTNIDCFAKRMYFVNITAEGRVFPCGWLADRMYGYETEMLHTDRKKLKDMIESLGGESVINLNYTSLEDIIAGPWFKAIEDTWENNYLERCAHQCGTQSTLIASATKDQWKNLMDIK